MNQNQWLVFAICVIFYAVVCVAVALRLVWLWSMDARNLWQRFHACPTPPRVGATTIPGGRYPKAAWGLLHPMFGNRKN